MVPGVADRKKARLLPVLIFALAASGIAGVWWFLSRPISGNRDSGSASAEAKAYLPNLSLSNVSMQATENFMRQQVVEVQGQISNKGPRDLNTVDVFCLFYGLDGRELYRERLAIVRTKGVPLHSGETRSFRLPFDSVPEGWNQALPKMVIAQITFAR